MQNELRYKDIWTKLRPPLVELAAEQLKVLVADLEQRGFAMPWLNG